MKKVLVTGAAGTIGYSIIKYLLSEGKYEITLLDIKNKYNIIKLKQYRKRVNIVYGDVINETLMQALIKDHNIVIHLAGAMPPLSNIKPELCEKIDYQGTKNIVDMIRMYNPKCLLLFPSSTTVYGDDQDSKKSSKSVVNITKDDHYSKYKYDTEKLVSGALKNFIIFRISPIINTNGNNKIYNIKLKTKVEFIKDIDVALAMVNSLNELDKLNQKTINISGGSKYQTTYLKYFINSLKTDGLTMSHLFYFFMEKNFHSSYYENEKYSSILKYQTGTLTNYYQQEKKCKKNKRLFRKLLAKPLIFILKKGEK